MGILKRLQFIDLALGLVVAVAIVVALSGKFAVQGAKWNAFRELEVGSHYSEGDLSMKGIACRPGRQSYRCDFQDLYRTYYLNLDSSGRLISKSFAYNVEQRRQVTIEIQQ